MKRWLLVGGLAVGCCGLCSVGAVVAGLAADDDPLTTAGCTNTVLDGWTQHITGGGVTLTKDGLTVELPWALRFDDAVRSGSVAVNLREKYLGPRFTAGPLGRGAFEDRFVFGPATAPDGTTVYTALSTGAANGVGAPVVVVARDEAAFRAHFSDEASLHAMQRLNAFPLRCAPLEGHWGESSSTGIELYSVTTGRFAGIEAVAGSLDLTLSAGHDYHQISTALVHGQYSKQTEDGTWAATDWGLTLTSSTGAETAYDASLSAVPGGFTLGLVNREFTGQRFLLVR